MKAAFISNICPHYRVKTYEKLSNCFDVDFYFYSAGDEWYWQRQHGVKTGNFNTKYLKGFNLGKTRITLDILPLLIKGNYDVYIKCINGRFVLPLVYLIARLQRKPFILWTGIWMRLHTPMHRLFYPITHFLYTHSDAVVVYGDHVKQFLIDEGVSPERIFGTTYAIDNDFYNQEVPDSRKKSLKESLNIQTDQKVILYLGRLEESKGISYLVKSVALVNSTSSVLVIAGEGTLRSSLEELVETLGIKGQVRFTGYVPQISSLDYYAIADLFVLPSITTDHGKEPWGLVVNEAFNQGVPVIATDAVGAAAGGLIVQNENGFIVSERSTDQLAEAIRRILTDDQLRKMFSANARKKMFTWNNENMVKGFKDAINYCLEN